MSLLKYVQTLALYDAWATSAVLKDCRILGQEKYIANAGLCFRSIHGTMCHIYAASQLWLYRMRKESTNEVQHLWSSAYSTKDSTANEYEQLFPNMDELEEALLRQSAEWQRFLKTQSDQDMMRELSYKTTNGDNATSPIGITACHVFNHATHHRGQATAAMSSLGGPVTSIDLAYFYRAKRGTLPLDKVDAKDI